MQKKCRKSASKVRDKWIDITARNVIESDCVIVHASGECVSCFANIGDDVMRFYTLDFTGVIVSGARLECLRFTM